MRRFLQAKDSKTVPAQKIPNVISHQDLPKYLAMSILNVCAYFNSEVITENVMMRYIEKFHQALGITLPPGMDSDALKKYLRSVLEKPLNYLQEHSFLVRSKKENEIIYVLHRSTQIRQRYCIKQNAIYWIDKPYGSNCFGLATDPESYYWWQAAETVRLPMDSRSKHDLAEHLRFVPHMETLLSHWQLFLSPANTLSSPIAAGIHYNGFYLLNWLGHKFMQAGQYKRSESYLMRALSTWKEQFSFLPTVDQILDEDKVEEQAKTILIKIQEVYPDAYLSLGALYAGTLRYAGRLAEFTLHNFDQCEKQLRLAHALYVQVNEQCKDKRYSEEKRKELELKEVDLHRVLSYDDLGYVLLEAGSEQKQAVKQEKATNIFVTLLEDKTVQQEKFRQYKCQVRLATLYLRTKDYLQSEKKLEEAKKTLEICNREWEKNHQPGDKFRNVDVYFEEINWYLAEDNLKRGEKAFALQKVKECLEIMKERIDFHSKPEDSNADEARYYFYKARVEQAEGRLEAASRDIIACVEKQKILYANVPTHRDLQVSLQLYETIDKEFTQQKQEQREQVSDFSFMP